MLDGTVIVQKIMIFVIHRVNGLVYTVEEAPNVIDVDGNHDVDLDIDQLVSEVTDILKDSVVKSSMVSVRKLKRKEEEKQTLV